MKKIIGLFMVAAFGLAPLAAIAQTETNNKKCDKTECARKCGKEGKSECKKDGKKRMNKDCNGDSCFNKLFAGINLTDQQKAQLKDLQAQQKAQREDRMAQHKALREDTAKARAAKGEKRDSTLTKEQHKAGRAEGAQARAEGKKVYLRKVREIIGEENYVIFLENMAASQPNQHGKAKMGKDRKNMKKELKADLQKDARKFDKKFDKKLDK